MRGTFLQRPLYPGAAIGLFCLTILGCNGSLSNQTDPVIPPVPSFTLSISPATINVAQQGSTQIQISVTDVGGFTGPVTITAGSLPNGITLSSSTLTASQGSPATLTINASPYAVVSQQTVAFSGTAGELLSNASIQLNVKGATVADPFHYIGGELLHGFYDESRQLLFATNLGLNELDVLSGSDLSVKARIPVPQPLDIDQMADGNTLVIGTVAQELVTVNEDTFAVTTHPYSASSEFFGLFFPTVVALANGKVFAIGQEEGIESNDIVDGGQTLFAWDSTTDTFTQIEPSSSTAGWETDRLARSGDHKWAVFSADQFYLYSSDSDSFTTVPTTLVNPPTNTYGVRGYAMNSDGSKLAVASANEVSFFDRSFDLLGTAPLPSAFQTARSNVQFSADNTKLYLQYAFPLTLLEVDATGYTPIGWVSASVAPDSDNLEGLLATNAEGAAYFNIEGGVRFVSLSQPPLSTSGVQGFSAPDCPPIDTTLALNTPGQYSTLSAFANSSIYVGGQPAPYLNGNEQLSIPASGTPGAVDQVCVDAQGDIGVVPNSVSYGVAPVALSANLLPPTGTSTVHLFGFGLSNATYGSAPSITVNGVASPSVATSTSSFTGSLQGAAFQLPPGTPGQAVNIGVTSQVGSGTLSNAGSFYPAPTILPTTGVLQLTFDPLRNRLYVLRATEIDVLDAASLKFLAPLAFPTGFTGTPASMGLTPDGSSLVVVSTSPGITLLVVDPTANTPSTATVCTVCSGLSGSMAMTAQDTAFLAGSPSIVFNIATRTFTSVPFVGSVLRASADGTHLYSVELNVTSGTVTSIEPVSGANASQSFGYLFWTDFAVSPDGSQFAAVDAPPYASGDAIGFFNSNLQYINANTYPDYSAPDATGVLGVTYSPGGKVLVVPLGDSIELWNSQTGTLNARLMTPEPLNELVYPENAVVPLIALNATGDTIFAASASGISVLPLPAPMDSLTPMQWPHVHPASSSSTSPATISMRMRAMNADQHK